MIYWQGHDFSCNISLSCLLCQKALRFLHHEEPTYPPIAGKSTTTHLPVVLAKSCAGIPCDMAVGSGGARFKSTVLYQLSLVDARFPDLMRIIKLWAKSYSLNDASQGTFNTFALTLMASFVIAHHTLDK